MPVVVVSGDKGRERGLICDRRIAVRDGARIGSRLNQRRRDDAEAETQRREHCLAERADAKDTRARAVRRGVIRVESLQR